MEQVTIGCARYAAEHDRRANVDGAGVGENLVRHVLCAREPDDVTPSVNPAETAIALFSHSTAGVVGAHARVVQEGEALSGVAAIMTRPTPSNARRAT